jgi:excisionase family DNA binding protein
METEDFTPEEAGVYPGVNPRSVYRLPCGGQLPGVKAGRQWRIRTSTLDAYLDGNRPEAGSSEKASAAG